MTDRKRSAEALALYHLVAGSGWTKTELAAELGLADASPLRHYENGSKSLSREQLDRVVAPLGLQREAPDLLIWAHHLIFPEPAAPPAAAEGDPLALSAEEQRDIDHSVLLGGWSFVASLRRTLELWKRERKVAEARLEAEKVAETLKDASSEDRQKLIAIFPEFRTWAVAEKLSDDSARAAAHRVDAAQDLAELAVCVARQVPGEAQRARTEGYSTGFLANVRRVATEFDEANEIFLRAGDLWKTGEAAASLPLAESRLLDLEASLRRAQERFPEALKLLHRAIERCDGRPLTIARLLMKKSNVLEHMGDPAGALAALKEAMPAIEASEDANLVFALRFNMAVNLCYLERYREAEPLISSIREMAIEQGRQIELIRLLWLSSKLAAGQGRAEEAMAGLVQVVRDFTNLPLALEAALAALDLAVLYLEAGRTNAVKALAEAMSWIFSAKGITPKALAAIALFFKAVRKDRATVALAKRVIAQVEKAQRSASPS